MSLCNVKETVCRDQFSDSYKIFSKISTGLGIKGKEQIRHEGWISEELLSDGRAFKQTESCIRAAALRETYAIIMEYLKRSRKKHLARKYKKQNRFGVLFETVNG